MYNKNVRMEQRRGEKMTKAAENASSGVLPAHK